MPVLEADLQVTEDSEFPAPALLQDRCGMPLNSRWHHTAHFDISAAPEVRYP